MRSRFDIKPFLVSQHLVPDVPAAAEGLFEKLCLGLIGIEADLDGGELDGVPVLYTPFLCLSRHCGPPPSHIPGVAGKRTFPWVKKFF